MKKIFVILLLGLIGPLQAAEPIAITHADPIGSDLNTELNYIVTSLGDLGEKSVPQITGKCVDTVKFWQSTTNPVIMQYSSNWPRTSIATDKACNASLKNSQVLERKIIPVWFCSSSDFKLLDTKDLKVLLDHPADLFIDEVQSKNKYSWKTSINSQGFFEKMINVSTNGVDYAFFNKSPELLDKIKSGDIKCHASSMQNDTIPYMNEFFKVKIDANNSLSFYSITVAKNLSESQIKTVKKVISDKKITNESGPGMNTVPLISNNEQMLTEFWKYTYQN
jgi:hypothetical protein